ncbi:uncharacterized protein LOC127621181 [Xyrauchen texanus]|uniref:uncharacterized protein LOC127621181 n=1 Tax=Xyrauchen texanus TaxID=154827 RepID=UPI002241B94C|nr:uncharacterized protein LOC127621181 [Xyrauchen texanus]
MAIKYVLSTDKKSLFNSCKDTRAVCLPGCDITPVAEKEVKHEFSSCHYKGRSHQDISQPKRRLNHNDSFNFLIHPERHLSTVLLTDRCLKSMSFNNASALESAMGDWRIEHNQTGQCAALLSPVIGSLKLVSGDGTSVGTVMTLQCPSRHRAVSGSHISCVWSSNSTHWTGGTPECKPLSRFEDEGFRLALLISFISMAIVLFMSFIFITFCLVSIVRREERTKMKRVRKREEAEFWQQIDIEGLEQQTEGFHKHKTKNNNNNNNRTEERNSTQDHPPQRTIKHLPTVICTFPAGVTSNPPILRTSNSP